MGRVFRVGSDIVAYDKNVQRFDRDIDMKEKIERFEDLIAWQKARELTKQIYDITRTNPFSKDFGLKDQIRRASIAVMSNIAEGFDRGGRAEFHRFLVIAKGSCNVQKAR